jgi:hypothetical protein
MQRPNFRYRFRRGFGQFFSGEQAVMRATSLLVVLAFAAGALNTATPSFADVSPTPTRSPDSTPSPTPSSTATPTPTPTRAPDSALRPQPKYVLKIPKSAPIDPRAKTYFLPLIHLAGSEYSLVCISGQGINFDLMNKRVRDNNPKKGMVMVSGDLGSTLLIAGQTQSVKEAINSNGGLMAYTSSGGLRDRSASLSITATNRPTLDPKFCSAADPANVAIFTFRALGIQVDTRKGAGKLK